MSKGVVDYKEGRYVVTTTMRDAGWTWEATIWLDRKAKSPAFNGQDPELIVYKTQDAAIMAGERFAQSRLD